MPKQLVPDAVSKLRAGAEPFADVPKTMRAAAHDAGSRAMRRRGLREWDDECWDVACAEYERLSAIVSKWERQGYC